MMGGSTGTDAQAGEITTATSRTAAGEIAAIDELAPGEITAGEITAGEVMGPAGGASEAACAGTDTAGGSTGPDPCGRLNLQLTRHHRLAHLMKSQLAELVPEGLDWGAFGILAAIVRCGPRRQGELAGVTMLDPSTVSRYVAQLVRAGFAERRADPADGRAVQLVATERGHRLQEDTARQRDLLLRQVLAHWSSTDVVRLTELLTRLNDDIEAARPHRPPGASRTDAPPTRAGRGPHPHPDRES